MYRGDLTRVPDHLNLTGIGCSKVVFSPFKGPRAQQKCGCFPFLVFHVSSLQQDWLSLCKIFTLIVRGNILMLSEHLALFSARRETFAARRAPPLSPAMNDFRKTSEESWRKEKADLHTQCCSRSIRRVRLSVNSVPLCSHSGTNENFPARPPRPHSRFQA